MKLNQKHSPERNTSDGDTYFRFLTRKRWKQAALFLACVVVFSTTYALILPAITLEQDTFCETEVHSHNEDCMEKTLICALQETEPDHVHTGECWSEKLICQETEHVHTDECYSDRKADLETADDWQKTLQNLELSGNAAGDSVRIAQSQLGYQESRLNYAVDENNVRHGYSRYNQWFYNLLKQYQSDTGNGKDLTSEDLPGLYDDWSVRFVQFVLTQAGVFTEEELAERYIREAEERLLEKDTENQSEETQTEQTADHVITDDEALEKLEAQIAWLKNDERFEYIYGMDLDSFQAGDIVIEKAVPDETAAAENEDKQNAEEEKEGEKDAGENQADQKADSSDDSEQAESEQLEADSRSPGIRISMVQEDDFLSARSIGKSAEGTVEQFEIDAQDPHWSLKGVYRLKTDAKSDPDAEDGNKEDGETPDGEETDPSETPEEADGKDEANSSTEKPKQNSELLHSYTYEDDELKIRLALRSKPGAQKDAAKAGAETKTSEDTEGTEEAAHDKEETEIPDYAAYQLKIQPVVDEAVSEKVEQMLTEQDEVLQSENIFRIVLENGSETLPLDEYDARVSVQVKPEAVESLLNEAASENRTEAEFPEYDSLLTLAKVENDDSVTELDSEVKGIMDETGVASTFSYDGEPIAYAATSANPHFTVQYYAYLNKVDIVDATEDQLSTKKDLLRIIDTKGDSVNGGKLPQNGNNFNVRAVQLVQKGQNYELKTTESLEKIFADKPHQYITSPNLSYFNRLFENGNYRPVTMYILKKGGNSESDVTAEDGDWTAYPFINNFDDSTGSVVTPNGELHFTNREEVYEKDKDHYIWIEDGMVIRLVYRETEEDFDIATNFFDYDISDGVWYVDSDKQQTYKDSIPKDKTAYLDTREGGINSSSNYKVSGFEGLTRFAFGNDNAGTNFGGLMWNGQTLNKGNDNNSRGNKTTFGIVQNSLDSNGNLQFSKGIAGPDLFNIDPEGSEKLKGKEYISEINNLVFDRKGDTYTLKQVTGDSDTEKPLVAADNLNTFRTWKTAWNSTRPIYTNDFWPMDYAKTFGKPGHDFAFGNDLTKKYRKYIPNGTLPEADDAGTFHMDHNSYFGMTFGVGFNLVEDYTGPLEYFFFGDDDMWVYLLKHDPQNPDQITSSKLICDIGGTHQSIGEYVDLRDYLPVGSSGQYSLRFFYTERGASGSTCYMQFTLPSLSSRTPEQKSGSLKISKEVVGRETDQEFKFNINFSKLVNGKKSPLQDDYAYVKYNSNGTEASKELLIHDGGTFELKHGQYIVVKNLPFGTIFDVEEVMVPGCTTKVNTNSSPPDFTDDEVEDGGGESNPRRIQGMISDQLNDQRVTVKFTNALRYELPQTGGSGDSILKLGIGVTAVALLGILLKKRHPSN